MPRRLFIRANRMASTVLGVCLSTSSVCAQWTATSLYDPALGSSVANAVDGNVQVGECLRAAMWTGTPGSWSQLWSGTYGAAATAAADGQIVGWEASGWSVPQTRAMLWTGSPLSVVCLCPGEHETCFAFGVSAGRQVGMSSTGQACMWVGTAASITILQTIPAASLSRATAITGEDIVGWFYTDSRAHACLWTGPAQTFVDLHPPGAFESQALAVSSRGQQAGYVLAAGAEHAALWNGTSQWTDLHPSGYQRSRVVGAFGTQQVGHVASGTVTHASFWQGSSQSWVDLHTFLPVGYDRSSANGIWSDAQRTRVVGYAHNAQTGRDEAMIWEGSAAPCYVNCDQSTANPVLNIVDFQCFINRFATGDPRANCDGTTVPPTLNINDFLCFLNKYVAGCL